jgi:quercetin dioxygenase-like cupin family protein
VKRFPNLARHRSMYGTVLDHHPRVWITLGSRGPGGSFWLANNLSHGNIPVMSRTLKITPTESVTVRVSTPELLEVEALYAPAAKEPPSHYHPSQDEHFEVLEGSIRVRAGDEERTLGVGDEIDIPRGTVHKMWNPASGDARVLWQTRPGGRTESWFASIDALLSEGRVGRNGMPGPLAFAALLTEYDDIFRLAVGPESLVRGALAVLAPLGRMRGYGAPPA